MEVRIGVQHVAREVAFESSQEPEEVRQAVTSAIDSGAKALELLDEKGRTVIIPTHVLGYVEVGVHDKGRVGFGTA